MHKTPAPWDSRSERPPEDYYPTDWTGEPAQIRTDWHKPKRSGPPVIAFVFWTIVAMLLGALLVAWDMSTCSASCGEWGAAWGHSGGQCVCYTPGGDGFDPNTKDAVKWAR